MQKKRLRPWVLIILSIICLTGIFYYSYEVILWVQHVKKNETLQKEMKKKIKITNELGEEKIEIDFISLKEQNPDTIAYIKVKNTNIDYIVVKGVNNQYYLNHNFEKEWNIAGWIFGDYRNRFDETDKNLIIYGHNTKDGSMFDSLIHVLDKDWQENPENQEITLVTEIGTYHYQVFSTYSIKPEDYYITTSFSGNEFSKFVETIQSRSNYDYLVDVSEDDKILTLSSCIGDGRKRVVLHAKLIEKQENSMS